jgi:glycosyltransferase involved in cell wall biosynthesis
LAARKVRDQFFPAAKVVVLSHIDPDELEAFKEGSDQGHKRSDLEREISSLADFVFAVGPRLERGVRRLAPHSDLVGGVPVVSGLLCGMNANASLRAKLPQQPTFLFTGRVEDATIKGVDLFAKAAGELVREWADQWGEHIPEWEPRFIIRGFPSDASKAAQIFRTLRDAARNLAGREVVLVQRPFSSNQKDLERDINDATVLVMPSRVEGFGLVAMEALSYGVPAIVSEDSGVGELFKSVLPPSTVARYVVDTRGNSAVQSLSRAFRHFALRPERSLELGRFLRDRLLPLCSWDAAAQTVCQKLGQQLVPTLALYSGPFLAEFRSFLLKEIEYANAECWRSCGRRIDEVFVSPTLGNIDDRAPSVIPEPGPTSEPTPGRNPNTVKWADVANDIETVVVLGAPGTGKTLCLLYEVSRRCRSAEQLLEAGSAAAASLPFAVYFHVNELVTDRSLAHHTLVHSAIQVLERRHGGMSTALRHHVLEGLTQGHVLLVIDGLDEIDSTNSGFLVGLGELRAGQPRSRILLASRSAVYDRSPLYGATQWQLQLLSPKQIRLIVRKWLASFPEDGELFLREVRQNPPLLDLFANPMLLMLAMRLYEIAIQRQEPRPKFTRRADIYGPFVSRLRENWATRSLRRGHTPGLSEQEDLFGLAEAVAWHLWHSDPRKSVFTRSEITRAIAAGPKTQVLRHPMEILGDLCDSGMIMKAGPEWSDAPYVFLHRTLLEYLAAKYASRHLYLTGSTSPDITAYIEDPNAQIFIWMLVGLLENPSPTLRIILLSFA